MDREAGDADRSAHLPRFQQTNVSPNNGDAVQTTEHDGQDSGKREPPLLLDAVPSCNDSRRPNVVLHALYRDSDESHHTPVALQTIPDLGK